MLDLSRDEFKLHDTSGFAIEYTVPNQHLPILQQGTERWQEEQAVNAGQHYTQFSRFQGVHAVVDLPVPPRLHNSIIPIRSGLQRRYQAASRNEFSHLRYTAVTCDASDFVSQGYQLRPRLFVKPREIEICVGITMYNEDDYLLGVTLEALHNNIKSLQHESQAAPWGPGSWQKIVVCIISDGRAKINHRTRALLASLGVYQDNVMLQRYESRDIVTHLFEYTTHSAIRINGNQIAVDLDSANAVPCQTILCLKEKNLKKINSHRWFLTAICRRLLPRAAVFLDAGCVPQPNSLYNLWEPLYRTRTVAATTGFCAAVGTSRVATMINPMVGYQRFEYQLTNALERPVESLLGRRFAVNKGGFVAYRFDIVASGDEDGGNVGFQEYFAGERLPSSERISVSKANSYLTEDRVISSGLLRTDLNIWRTVSVESAEVVTDVPESLSELILQRRRWINGDFYSSLHELRHTFSYIRLRPLKLLKPFRILGLLLSTIYQIVTTVLQFFAIGNLFAIFCIITTSTGHEMFLGGPGRSAAIAMSYIYLSVFAAGLLCSMGNRPQGSTAFYAGLSILWVIIYGYLLATLLYLVIRGSTLLQQTFHRSASDVLTDPLCYSIAWPLVVMVGIWLIAPLVLLRKPHSISSFIHYCLFSPAYANLVTIYARCNTHDISFGVGGDPEKLPLPSTRPFAGARDGEHVILPTLTETDYGDLIFWRDDDHPALLDDYHVQEERVCATAPVRDINYRAPSDRYMDGFKMHRLMMLLMWLGLNSALVMVVVNIPAISSFTPTTDGGHGLAYVATVLWAYAGVAGFQFCCTILYGLSRLASYLQKRAFPSRRTNVDRSLSEVPKH